MYSLINIFKFLVVEPEAQVRIQIGPFSYAVGAQCMPEVWYQNYFQGKWLLSDRRFCLEE